MIRTLTSIESRSNKNLLKEILVIDDASKGPFKYDMKLALQGFKKVRLIQVKDRMGANKCRQMGAEEAEGDVLVFLDSHVEVNEGWLEPLLVEIKEDPKVKCLTMKGYK